MIRAYISQFIQYLSVRGWPAIVWTLLILTLCLAPSSDLPEAPSIEGLDKIVHIGLFAVWSFLWTNYKPGKAPGILLLGVVMGTAIEFLQEMTAMGRSFEWWDLAADVLGLLIGSLFRTFLVPKFFSAKKA